jgi:hypothetical protein
MDKRLGGLIFALFSGPIMAAPFCVVTSYGTNCWYYDAPSCQRAASSANGMCVVNQQEQARSSGSAPFCVVTQVGTNCWYYDADSCRSQAASANGACIVNPDR